jgi:adenylate kinase
MDSMYQTPEPARSFSNARRASLALGTLDRAPLNIVLFGPPGAGKGTQADRFSARHGIPKISTGEILRKAIQDGTELGAAVSDTLRRGGLVNDDLMIRVVQDRLARPDTRGGFLLDGFPRTVPQAKALDTMMAERGDVIVIALHVMADVLVDRLSARGRADDQQRVIRERLQIYSRDTEPVIDYYTERGLVAVLDGHRPPDVVSQSIEKVITRSRATVTCAAEAAPYR